MHITPEQFHALQPCREGLQWALAQPSLAIAWDTCERGDWMWWLLSKRGDIPKETSVLFAQDCADAAADAAARAAAAWAADAAAWAAGAAAWAADAAASVAAAAAAWAAGAAAAAADAAADAAAARAAERKRQADFIRTLVPNPFQP